MASLQVAGSSVADLLLGELCSSLPVAAVQGVYSPTTFSMLQLPKEWYNALEWQYPPHQVSTQCSLVVH